MIVCIPIDEDRGMNSPVCAHFGRAPAFLLVNTDEATCRPVSNGHDHRAHGQCLPVDLLASERVEALIVGGIGRGALHRLASANIRVYRAQGQTVDETLTALRDGTLPHVDPDMACTQHGHDHSGDGSGE